MQGEYRGDFTRDTFDPAKHFSRVLMQQGRVQLDADWNEQAAILLHYIRVLAADLIGPHGGPGPDPGFAVQNNPELKNDFEIGPGRYYVNGITCELGLSTAIELLPSVQGAPNNQVQVSAISSSGVEFQSGQYVEIFDADTPSNSVKTSISAIGSDRKTMTLVAGLPATLAKATNLRIQRLTTYTTQPYYDARQLDNSPGATPSLYLAYLDVWERHITRAQDEAISEVALGGPDTATRAQVVWQVRTTPYATGTTGKGTDGSKLASDYQSFLDALGDQIRPGTGRLKARARKTPIDTDACSCVISPESKYRGTENQLYRLEIHDGGKVSDGSSKIPKAGTATFKWSRENTSVMFPISGLDGLKVTVENLGLDSRLGLKMGDWVEAVDDNSSLLGAAGPLLQVTDVDTTNLVVTLSVQPGLNLKKHPLLRRWDSKGAVPVEVPSVNDGWLQIEDGIEVRFNQADSYKSGDYWLIPARVATGNVEWPGPPDQPESLPPHGIKHHYAPLWFISVGSDGLVTFDSKADCRIKFNLVK